MATSMDVTRNSPQTDADARWLDVFTDRYGVGSRERLLALLQQPCVTFADIAEQYHVTRERVRQWHLQLFPEGPRGHARQRLCWVQRQKKHLLRDPLFRTFYRHARPHVGANRFTLIPIHDGFRKRAVRLDNRLIVLKSAREARRQRRADARAYALGGYGGAADFVYYRLTDDGYLFMPRNVAPAVGTTFLDSPHSKYYQYRNTFEAVEVKSP